MAILLDGSVVSQIFDGVLSTPERERAERTLRKLAKHNVSRWILTGGFATEMHMRLGNGEVKPRALYDIDFIVDSFAAIPESIGLEFLLRHVHPDDPEGKTLLQFVDPETRIRVDVFGHPMT